MKVSRSVIVLRLGIRRWRCRAGMGLVRGILVGRLADFMFGRAARKEGPLDWVDLRIEYDRVEMPDHDGGGSEDCLIEMDCGADVEDGCRMGEAGEDPVIEPKGDAGDGHDGGAPHQGPVFGLLGVVEAAVMREL